MNRSERRREIWKKREEEKLCIYCGNNSPIDNRKGCSDCLNKKSYQTIKFSKENRKKINQYILLLKHQVIEKYGGKCSCCNESEILFLTIDHKNNDGNVERKNTKTSSTSFYLKLRREDIRNDIQVLCWNCNMGKNINMGMCPHKGIKRKLDRIYDRRNIPQFDTRLKIIWPNDDDLIKMCNEASIAEIARNLKVDFSAVSGRLKRRNKYHLVNKKTGKNKK